MFGKSNRRTPQGPAYDPRIFVTNNARQQALDDYVVMTLSAGGLAGLRPLYQMVSAEHPHGFDYVTNVIGLGGTRPANQKVNNPQPLLYTIPGAFQSFIADGG